MLELLFLILGFILNQILCKNPLQIVIHHKNETINNNSKDVDMEALQEEMLKDDPKLDQEYEKLGEVVTDVANIMGGSDR